jgi:hypothetical protein
MKLLVILNPVTPLLLHLFHNLVALITDEILLDDVSSCLEVIHEFHASLPALLLGLSHALERVSNLLLDGHGTSCHAQEVEFLLSELLNSLARQNTLDTFLYEQSSSILFLFSSLFFYQALTDLLV